MSRPRLPAALFTILLTLAFSSAHAQDKGGISGRATEKKAGHAIAFASVTVVEAKKGSLTDSEGQYLITGVAPGTYEVRVQFLGYQAISKPGVVVTAGKTVTINFEMNEIVVHEEKVTEI